MRANYICDDAQNVLDHIKENSQDLLFSCPPYFDLEVYSDLPNDASNQQTYGDFLKILENAFTSAIKCLKDDRFAVIVVGDIRDKNGFYYRFPDDIKNIFTRGGMELYNEMILVEALGTLPQRVNKLMGNRKVGKCHQNVLVFYKGNPKTIKDNFKKLTFSEAENES
jgi:DNA modification methylase